MPKYQTARTWGTENKTVPKNQKEMHCMFLQKDYSLYYAEWTDDIPVRVEYQFSCVLEVRYCAVLMSCLEYWPVAFRLYKTS